MKYLFADTKQTMLWRQEYQCSVLGILSYVLHIQLEMLTRRLDMWIWSSAKVQNGNMNMEIIRKVVFKSKTLDKVIKGANVDFLLNLYILVIRNLDTFHSPLFWSVYVALVPEQNQLISDSFIWMQVPACDTKGHASLPASLHFPSLSGFIAQQEFWPWNPWHEWLTLSRGN